MNRLHPKKKIKRKGLEDGYVPEEDKIKLRSAMIETKKEVVEEITDIFKFENVNDYVK